MIIPDLKAHLALNSPLVGSLMGQMISAKSTCWDDFRGYFDQSGLNIEHIYWTNCKITVRRDGVILANAGARNPAYYGKGIMAGFNEFLNYLLPSTHYIVDSYMYFHTDDRARTIKSECVFGNRRTTYRGRNSLKRTFLKDNDGKETDEIGHLIPNLVGGPNEAINVVPMGHDTNHKGAFSSFERLIETAWYADDEVCYSVEPAYSSGSRRPTGFLLKLKINCKAAGQAVVSNGG